jgi:hypothetical protein
MATMGTSDSSLPSVCCFPRCGAVDRWRDEYGEDRRMGGAVLRTVLGGDFRAGDSSSVRPEVSLLGGMGEAFGRALISIGYRF